MPSENKKPKKRGRPESCMPFIRLTRYNTESPVWVNIDQIQHFSDAGGYTLVNTNGYVFEVKERWQIADLLRNRADRGRIEAATGLLGLDTA